MEIYNEINAVFMPANTIHSAAYGTRSHFDFQNFDFQVTDNDSYDGSEQLI